VDPFPRPTGVAWSAAAGLFEAAYFVLLVMALERCALSAAYTVSRGLAIVAVWPVSVALMGEPVTPLSIAGTALLCLGLAASGLERSRETSRAGVLMACLCGLAIAGYHLCYKQALETGAHPAAVFGVALGLAFPLNLVRLGRARLPALGRKLRRRPLFSLGLGAAAAASFLVLLVALGRGGTGAVLTLRNTSIVFTAVMAWIVGQRPSRAQLVGAALVTAGAILVGLAG
jgi:drug/metabolite transporter (DMT)-like permease